MNTRGTRADADERGVTPHGSGRTRGVGWLGMSGGEGGGSISGEVDQQKEEKEGRAYTDGRRPRSRTASSLVMMSSGMISRAAAGCPDETTERIPRWAQTEGSGDERGEFGKISASSSQRSIEVAALFSSGQFARPAGVRTTNGSRQT